MYTCGSVVASDGLHPISIHRGENHGWSTFFQGQVTPHGILSFPGSLPIYRCDGHGNGVTVKKAKIGTFSGSRKRRTSTVTDVNDPTKTKVVKVYACIHEDCTFTATYRKDLLRHLRSDQHRSSPGKNPFPGNRFYCSVLGCKKNLDGFSRKDNFRRHMHMMHSIHVDGSNC
ncbi:hypothetical protein GGR57DRAFT_320690 [Xylariaceae sp. FL1272]|nr:hypothetical protein GGR57DRAFT_320690 [Xylariaceae sp. FL1272]